MNGLDLQRNLLLTQVRSLIFAYQERFGVNPYDSVELDILTAIQLTSVRRDLYEVLRASPPRL